MTKLLVLDKDNTIVQPKSGNTFSQHPEDQELIEGVSEAIQRHVTDGWTIAIASNQGGCQIRDCKAIDFPVGAYYVNGSDKPLMIIRKNQIRELVPHSNETEPFVMMHTAEPRPNGKDYLYFSADSSIQFQYKTIDMAIAEMQYAMKLIGIQYHGLFCPDMQGNECYITSDFSAPPLHKVDRYKHLIGSFRKPDGGMLLALKQHFETHLDGVDTFLMVGDRPEDQEAAKNAGFDFIWAEDWRS